MIHILRIRKKDQCFWLKTATGVCFVMFSKNVFVFCVMASLSIQCVGILRRAQLLAPNILDHLKEPVLFQEQSLTAILEEACTETVCPAKCVNLWIFVKVVAVFTDVVQLNIHGGVMFPMALLRNPSPVPEIEVASPP